MEVRLGSLVLCHVEGGRSIDWGHTLVNLPHNRLVLRPLHPLPSSPSPHRRPPPPLPPPPLLVVVILVSLSTSHAPLHPLFFLLYVIVVFVIFLLILTLISLVLTLTFISLSDLLLLPPPPPGLIFSSSSSLPSSSSSSPPLLPSPSYVSSSAGLVHN